MKPVPFSLSRWLFNRVEPGEGLIVVLEQGPANTLRFIVRDVRPHMPRNYSFTLIDVGLVINKLMGGAYRSSYTRRKFRSLYQHLTKRPPAPQFAQSALGRVYRWLTPPPTLPFA